MGTGVAFAGSSAGTEPVSVYVSIVPQVYFVNRIGKEFVSAKALVKPGESPATYSPGARQMADFMQSDVFFSIGVPFEKALLPKISAAARHPEIVDTSKGIKLRKMLSHVHGHEEHDVHEDEHGHDGLTEEEDHGHEHADRTGRGFDPHIWMSPDLVVKQAGTICDGLCRLRPDKAGYFRQNLADFVSDLNALSGRIAARLEPIKGKKLFVYHPAYGYFADQFGLVQVAVELEGKQPAARQVAALVDEAKKQGCRVIFVQPQFSRKTAQVIASEINGVVVGFDPLRQDYIENLDGISRVIAERLG